METTDRILAYLSEEMSEDQKIAFEKELGENPALRQEFSFYQDLNLAGDIFGEGGVVAQLENTWNENQAKPEQTPIVQLKDNNKRIPFFGNYRLYIAVVLLVIVVGVVWRIQDQWKSSNILDDPKAYAARKAKLEQQYQSARIEMFDRDLKFGRKRGGGETSYLARPKLDTLVVAQEPVFFQWEPPNSDKSLLLEILTKETQEKPIKVTLPANTMSYRQGLVPGLYYWRLSTMNAKLPEKVLKIGRFYVTNLYENE
ncbi:MAG TPA: hypothetical protein DCS93_44035 [Microscillaceae bacterium]|nr:hypothetical protein [Microscillaceae bacterium]